METSLSDKVLTIGIMHDGDNQNNNYHLLQHFRDGSFIFCDSLCLSADQCVGTMRGLFSIKTQYRAVFPLLLYHWQQVSSKQSNGLSTHWSIMSPAIT